MSVTPEKRKGKLTGQFVARYRNEGKRYHVGTYPTQKVAEVAERVHRKRMGRLAGLNINTVKIETMNEGEHTAWRPLEQRNLLTIPFDMLADRFADWRRNRRIRKALEKDTEEMLKADIPAESLYVFDKD